MEKVWFGLAKLDRMYRFNGEPRAHPPVESTEQRTDALDPASMKAQCRSRAGDFVWTRAIENNIPVPWNFRRAVSQFLGQDLDRSRHFRANEIDLLAVPEIDNGERIARSEKLPNRFRGYPGRPQAGDEAAPKPNLQREVRDEHRDHQDDKTGTETGKPQADSLHFAIEQVAESHHSAHPERSADGIEEEETMELHAKQACQRGGDRIQPWNVLREDQRERAVPMIEIAGPPGAIVRLQGEPAERTHHVVAVPAAEKIPKGVRPDASRQSAQKGVPEIKMTCGRQCACREHHRRGRQGQPQLLEQDEGHQ